MAQTRSSTKLAGGLRGNRSREYSARRGQLWDAKQVRTGIQRKWRNKTSENILHLETYRKANLKFSQD